MGKKHSRRLAVLAILLFVLFGWRIRIILNIGCLICLKDVKRYTERKPRFQMYIGGMSDIAIYDSEFDDGFWEQPDQDNYVVIRFLKKI